MCAKHQKLEHGMIMVWTTQSQCGVCISSHIAIDRDENVVSLRHMTAMCTFAELLKEDTEGSKHGCPGHIKHGSHGFPLSSLKEGRSLCLLSASTSKLSQQAYT